MTSLIPENTDRSSYRWYVLTLAALTHTVVVGMPLMAIPVLFDEMARELNLDLVQMGWVWGLGFLTGIITSVVGGSLGDRFGAQRTLAIGSILSGFTGALRGFSMDFGTLAATAFFFGLVPPAIPMNVHKICGIWFPGRNLGLANGVVSAGMALGFLLGSLLSATVFSPWLGGWRRVLFLYGALSVIVGIFWSFTRSGPALERSGGREDKVSLRQALPLVARMPIVWILGLTMVGIGGSVHGTLGYLPLYLRRIGWADVHADLAMATFHGVSLAATIPLVMFSDRIASRRGVLMGAALLNGLGVLLFSIPTGFSIWIGVIMAGLVRDGFMAILMTLVLERREIGLRYSGTSMGLILVFSRLGSLISPPLGNSLAHLGLTIPFLFWAALAFLAFGCLWTIQRGDK